MRDIERSDNSRPLCGGNLWRHFTYEDSCGVRHPWENSLRIFPSCIIDGNENGLDECVGCGAVIAGEYER